MKLLHNIFASLVYAILASLLVPQPVQAAPFAELSLRLDRLAPSSPLSGLFCARPSAPGAGSEGKIAITFPSDFTISSTLANWTTSTTSLPAGSTAWPGISATATSISGTTVTFTSSDLPSNTLYCFTFSASGSTTGNTGTKSISISSFTSTNTLIDTQTMYTTIGPEQITVGAAVPAAPGDYTTSIKAFPEDLPIREGIAITYEITYSSSLSYPTNITLEAAWGLGTIEGMATPSVEIVDYINGSASKGYNNTSPVIDVVNKKITWTLPQFPGNNIPHTVQFKLLTTSNYKGLLPVAFTTASRILGPGTATPDTELTLHYRYGVPSQRATPTPGPTATPLPGTPTPTPIPQAVGFQRIQLPEITSTSVQVQVGLSGPGTVSLRYGTNYTAFSERQISPSIQYTHLFRMDKLTPDTVYYFQIQATSRQGKTSTSDIYTFTTAQISTPLAIMKNSVTLTSQKVLLINSALSTDRETLPTAVIPYLTHYEFHFSLQEDRPNTSIRARLTNEQVLGLHTSIFAEQAAETEGVVNEIQARMFVGKLSTPATPGDYVLSVEIRDRNGNLTQKPLLTIKVTPPFIIQSDAEKKPVENAQILLSYFNHKSKIYERISSLPFSNPSFSSPQGIVPVVLPTGRYEAEITHPLYERKVVRFTLGPHPQEEYPLVLLHKTGSTFIPYLIYIKSAITDIFSSLGVFSALLTASSRVMDLVMLFSLVMLSVLSIVALRERLHVPLLTLPSYVRYKVQLLRRTNTYLKVTVKVHGTHRLLRHAIIKTNHYETLTDKTGTAYLLLPATETITLSVTHQGFITYNATLPLTKDKQHLTIALQPDTTFHPVLTLEKQLVTNLISGGIEVWIGMSLLMCVLFGITNTLPLFILSLINAALWIEHLAVKIVLRNGFN